MPGRCQIGGLRGCRYQGGRCRHGLGCGGRGCIRRARNQQREVFLALALQPRLDSLSQQYLQADDRLCPRGVGNHAVALHQIRGDHARASRISRRHAAQVEHIEALARAIGRVFEGPLASACKRTAPSLTSAFTCTTGASLARSAPFVQIRPAANSAPSPHARHRILIAALLHSRRFASSPFARPVCRRRPSSFL